MFNNDWSKRVDMLNLPQDKDWRFEFRFLAGMGWLEIAFFRYNNQIIQTIQTIQTLVNNTTYEGKFLFRDTKDSTIYLTKDEEKVVKIYRGKRVGLARYEIAATKFYQEKGIPVAPIIDFSFDASNEVAYIVKPMIEGITKDYLSNPEVIERLGQEHVDNISESSTPFISRIFNLHEYGVFRIWLEENHIAESSFGEFDGFVDVGDIFRDENIIFTLDQGWIVLDP